MSKEKEDEGVVSQEDYDPEFHEMEEDFNLEQMKKTNPGLYELMKKHGAETGEDADESATKED